MVNTCEESGMAVENTEKIPQESSNLNNTNDHSLDNNTEPEPNVDTKLLENGTANKEGKILNGKDTEKGEQERLMTDDINKLLKEMPLTEDTTCGFWFLKGAFFQRFANQTAYVILYGIVGCIYSMTYAYFNGTITTIEKRFKIPSKNTGIISVGNDISMMMVSAVLSYYAGKGHRPRWIGFGLVTIVIFCLLTATPHFLYGPGEDALALTVEFGAIADENATMEAIEQQRSKTLCRMRAQGGECELGESSNFAPQVVLFVAQLVSGVGGSLYYTLGVSYMDDNTKKTRTPALLSLSYFLRMLGPAFGYALASVCLRSFIAPQLQPVIGQNDPRWLGAWWLGWLIIGGLLLASSLLLSMFPKDLPRAVARRKIEEMKRKKKMQSLPEKTQLEYENENIIVSETKSSFKDMLKTFKRLTTNKTLMCNNFSSVFYLFGYTPYWIFTPKYIEIQYRQSASTSSMVTGTVALAFSAIGVLLSGFIISKYKPRARYMAAWNVIVGALTVLGMMTYAFIGCPENENSMIVNIHDSSLNNSVTCNSDCNCDYVRYSPVCGEDSMTYISPCHAGCRKQHIGDDGRKVFYDCACIKSGNSSIFGKLSNQEMAASDMTLGWKDTNLDQTTPSALPLTTLTNYPEDVLGGQAIPGSCPINCFTQFVTFLAVMCCLKFVGASGRASNFLVSVRCVPEKDKTVSMGFGMMMMSMMAFIPSPIFFGWVIDNLCLVWGKTCTNKGNCWLYDPKSLRYTLNSLGSTFVLVGTLFDVGVWYFVKDLQIFDEEVKDMEMDIVQHEEEVNQEKAMEA